MQNQTKKMTEGSPAALILTFALPLMLGNVFQQLYTVVDTIVVGQFLGVEALAAIGSIDWLTWMMLGLIQGLTQGCGVVLSQYFGAEDYRGLKRNVVNAAFLSLLFAGLLTAVGFVIAKPMLMLLRTPEQIFDLALAYLLVVFGGIPVIVAYNFFACVLRAVGNSKAPLRAMVISCLVNIALDILFVVVFHMGIRGAAIATVIAQAVSAVYCLVKIIRIPVVRPEVLKHELQLELCIKQLAIGMPMAMQNLLIAVGGMILQYVVNGFGVALLAGYTATNKLYGILEIAATSYGFAMSVYAGQNMGAKQLGRIRKGTRSAIFIGVATAVVIMLAMLFGGQMFLGMFISKDADNAALSLYYAFLYLKIMAAFLPILYILHIVRSCIQGMGNSVLPMLSGIAEFVMRTGGVLVLPGLIGEASVFYAEVLAWCGADVVLVSSYIYMIRRVKRLFGEASGED